MQKLPLLEKIYPTQAAFVWRGVFFGYRVALVGSLAISLGRWVSAPSLRTDRPGCSGCQSSRENLALI